MEHDMIPSDYETPDFATRDKVHDWKNYAGDDLTALWMTLTSAQKLAIALTLQDIADREEWE